MKLRHDPTLKMAPKEKDAVVAAKDPVFALDATELDAWFIANVTTLEESSTLLKKLILILGKGTKASKKIK